MNNKQIELNGIFDRYTPINEDPYYVFSHSTQYLVKCTDVPELIGKLYPTKRIQLKGGIEKQIKEGILLNDVEYELLDE